MIKIKGLWEDYLIYTCKIIYQYQLPNKYGILQLTITYIKP